MRPFRTVTWKCLPVLLVSLAKWQARFVIERGPVELAESALLVALLAALPGQPTAAARGVEALFEQRGERKLADAVGRW